MNMAKQTRKEDGLLTTAAKAIGSAAGKVVSTLGGHENEAPPSSEHPGDRTRSKGRKLPKKHKSRLPRRQKKASKSAAAPAGSSSAKR